MIKNGTLSIGSELVDVAYENCLKTWKYYFYDLLCELALNIEWFYGGRKFFIGDYQISNYYVLLVVNFVIGAGIYYVWKSGLLEKKYEHKTKSD